MTEGAHKRLLKEVIKENPTVHFIKSHKRPVVFREPYTTVRLYISRKVHFPYGEPTEKPVDEP